MAPRRQVYQVTKADEPERDHNGAPKLIRVGAHISTLERMLEHRETALDRQENSPGVLGYYSKEAAALRASIAALTFHRATIERFPEFVEALCDLVEVTSDADSVAVQASRKRAQVVLDEYRDLV